MALDKDAVKTWGWNEFRQLGRSCEDQPVCVQPKDAIVSSNISSLFAGGYGHAGVVMHNGTVFGFGWSQYGQLGDPTEKEYQELPMALPIDQPVARAVSGSFKHSVFHLKDQTVVGIGSNSFFQIK